MVELSLITIGISFAVGVLTFFAPCTLPLVPAFLGVIAGVGQDELQDPEKLRAVRGRIFKNSIFYVLGFSLVFILFFGVFFSLLGQVPGVQLWIERIGGVLMIAFGLFVLGILKIPALSVEKKIQSTKLYGKVSYVNSFGIGALFGLGWSPCIGPFLGGVLILAGTAGSVVQGVILLSAFSLGLGIPFLITALLVGKAFTAFARWTRVIEYINAVGGGVLLLLGVLLVTGEFNAVLLELQSTFRGINKLEDFLIEFQS